MPNPFIALISGLILVGLGLLVFWPGGLWNRWERMRRMTARVLREDALKHIHRAEIRGEHPSLQSLAGALQINVSQAAELVADMESQELLGLNRGEMQLTPTGRDYALQIIRAHRLWERYLAEETGVNEADWHEEAEWNEHLLTPQEMNELAARLGHPTYDPHGDPIPTAQGSLVAHGGQPLTAAAVGEVVRIVHLEDEPATVYAQLVAEGLHPGMQVRLIENGAQRVRFWANGSEHLLAPLLAGNVSVRRLVAEPQPEQPLGEPLNLLQPGEQGRILGIAPRCRGPERRRLMDLGILPGTIIEAEFVSPSGDPTAYRVRGSMLALRAEQAGMIRIQRGNGDRPTGDLQG